MKEFDGVICFGGEDWWYHNRGHFDMQIMRELSGRVPVLYINSVGMRVPRAAEGWMFLRRVARKLRSIRRGFVIIREHFAVLSPLAAPGRFGRLVSKLFLPMQVRRAMRRLGIQHPVLWIACPPGVQFLDELNSVGVVYQRTDRYESFSHVNTDEIHSNDRTLKQRADFTIFCSRTLLEEEREQCSRSVFIDHGVDFDRFAAAGTAIEDPDDVAPLPRPRVGFVGGIDAHTFDPQLFRQIATTLSEVTFVVVGASSLSDDWSDLPNVHHLGQRQYELVPRYMASCDVLIMPWNSSPWIRACNPVKLKEYLAVGRPVVSTPFDELDHYNEVVSVANGAEAFINAIRAALNEPGNPLERRNRVQDQTWANRGEAVLRSLLDAGLKPGGADPVQPTETDDD